MRGIALPLVLLMLAVAMGSAQTCQFASTPYNAPTFSATFPVPDTNKASDAVQYSSSNNDKSGATVTTQQYTLWVHNNACGFSITYSDIPGLQGGTANMDRSLGSMPGMQDANFGPKTDSVLSGLPARKNTVTGYIQGSRITMYRRIAIRGDRLWLVMMTTTSENCNEADANKFFGSIKIK